MRTRILRTVPLGDLVVAAFDSAACFTSDPREVSRLATRAVAHMLRRAPRRLTDRAEIMVPAAVQPTT